MASKVDKKAALTARNEEVCQLYASGEDLKEISKAYGLTVGSIQQLAHKAKARRPKTEKGFHKGRPPGMGTMTEQNRLRQLEICDYYIAEDCTLQEAGEHFGITRERVRQILNMNGIGARTFGVSMEEHARKEELQHYGELKVEARKLNKEITDQRIRELYNAGARYKDIMAKIDKSLQYVQQSIERTGGVHGARGYKHGAPRKEASETQKKWREKFGERFGKNRTKLLSDEQEAVAKDMYATFQHVRVIAAKMGVEEGQMRSILHRLEAKRGAGRASLLRKKLEERKK